ncbi:DUF402 domain-containing protein [Saccharopolyspora phatthalungensis]|uniref:DUF402 domain-containing protein n=1 Tax=Saccharopolyspora phatthalungensis TaxID=664693 RepID=A0A840QGB4_9PSEU|nr:DUF402 domain-containing protein [Saccharopolyspora phatthalungensis]MBB5156193.1 hypothetical protein [Saccharopolyspora phatthalungensis]
MPNTSVGNISLKTSGETLKWAPGGEVLYSFWRLDDSLGTVHPARVVADDGDQLLCWVLDGTPIRITTSPDGRSPRQMPLSERFNGPRVPAKSTWRGTSTLRLVFEHRWASVWWFFEPDGTFRNWYVNLEVPWGRDATGVRRVDGVLDVEVFPDGCWSWKDENEVPDALAAGRFDERHLSRLQAEGERMIALAEAGRFPFDGTYCDARPDPEWALPSLPEGLLLA